MMPFVNTDIKMSKAMMQALTRFEFFCIGSKINEVTEEDVTKYLSEQFGETLARQFKQEFLFSSPET
jgi:hypothetical protein